MNNFTRIDLGLAIELVCKGTDTSLGAKTPYTHTQARSQQHPVHFQLLPGL